MKRLKSILFSSIMTLAMGCTTTFVQSTPLPYGTSATGVSIRDAFSNDSALIVYDKDGKIVSVVPGNSTTAAAAWSSAANGAIVAGMTATLPGLISGTSSSASVVVKK